MSKGSSQFPVQKFDFPLRDANYPCTNSTKINGNSVEKNLYLLYFSKSAEKCLVLPFTFILKYLYTETPFLRSETRWAQNIIAIRDMLSFQKKYVWRLTHEEYLLIPG